MLTDPHKTLLSIELSEKRKHVPPWVYKVLVEPNTNANDEEEPESESAEPDDEPF